MIPLIQGFPRDEEARSWAYEVSICYEAGQKAKPVSHTIWNSNAIKATMKTPNQKETTSQFPFEL